MRTFQVIFLVILSFVLVGVYAPIVADHYKSVSSKAMAAKYEADKKQRLIEACATGKTSHIMYNGKVCKGN
jgi:hypothetical protein